MLLSLPMQYAPGMHARENAPALSPPARQHLDTGACMQQDREQVLSRARRAGVEAVVITGSSLRSTEAAAGLAGARASPGHPQLYFTAGVHPHEAKSCDGGTIPRLRQFLAHERCVAVGECGLDFNRRGALHNSCLIWLRPSRPQAVSWQGRAC